ncbi:mitogen-activated protein kinase kinase kinase 5-like isoform X2 [Daucus carota subsp. sativus]|uniref:mitogen-activated protein kinase kinase kinase 5-like isoform X2 n=1 Tax=Daucus carota subsp. sativus TaxID=79200 RepID=UPI003082C882
MKEVGLVPGDEKSAECIRQLEQLSGQAANLSLKGSPYWMAPELIHPYMQNESDPDLALAVDIWSLGCTIIEMAMGD